MSEIKWIKFIGKLFNVLQIISILIISLIALALQFFFHEIPCPLCLLQRIGFLYIAFGFLLNLRFGFKPSHYAVALLSGLFTSAVALRQIALHVLPHSGSYGDAIFGLHLYTWSFMIAMIITVLTSIMLGIDAQYKYTNGITKSWRYTQHILFILVTLVLIINLIATFSECGLGVCPDNPVTYKFL